MKLELIIQSEVSQKEKHRCCKEEYSIKTWNVESTNHGKFEVVKKEMVTLTPYNRLQFHPPH